MLGGGVIVAWSTTEFMGGWCWDCPGLSPRMPRFVRCVPLGCLRLGWIAPSRRPHEPSRSDGKRGRLAL